MSLVEAGLGGQNGIAALREAAALAEQAVTGLSLRSRIADDESLGPSLGKSRLAFDIALLRARLLGLADRAAWPDKPAEASLAGAGSALEPTEVVHETYSVVLSMPPLPESADVSLACEGDAPDELGFPVPLPAPLPFDCDPSTTSTSPEVEDEGRCKEQDGGEPENCDTQSTATATSTEEGAPMIVAVNAKNVPSSRLVLNVAGFKLLCVSSGPNVDLPFLSLLLRLAWLTKGVDAEARESETEIASSVSMVPRRGLILLVADVYLSLTPFITTLLALAG